MIARVWRREEIYQGPRLQDAPDVVALERDGYLVLNWVPAPDAGRAVYPADENFFSAYHRSNGILIARGPGIVPGRTVEGARIIDITPTLLAIFRVPVPDNVDGTVLTQLFEPSWAKSHPVARQPAVAVVPRSSGTSASIEDQLRSVGYLR